MKLASLTRITLLFDMYVFRKNHFCRFDVEPFLMFFFLNITEKCHFQILFEKPEFVIDKLYKTVLFLGVYSVTFSCVMIRCMC